MKFAIATVTALLMSNPAGAFVPYSPMKQQQQRSSSSARFMAVNMPPPEPPAIVQTTDLPVIASNPMGQPSGVRYSDFLKLVNADKIEKVTFSADGSQLLGVDVDGSRLKIDTLPNDPDLLAQLTSHKVRDRRTKQYHGHSTLVVAGRTLLACSPRLPIFSHSRVVTF